jgi:hypothetical protein
MNQIYFFIFYGKTDLLLLFLIIIITIIKREESYGSIKKMAIV